jgi:hypothetical protein
MKESLTMGREKDTAELFSKTGVIMRASGSTLRHMGMASLL